MNNELTIYKINQTKGLAICFMLLLHLFATKNYEFLYTPLIFISGTPLIYYLALFGDCCVAIFCFCSGYGLHRSYSTKSFDSFKKRNLKRVFDLYLNLWLILIVFVLIIGPLLGKSARFPGDYFTFFLNFTAIRTSYNGAWWFFTIYILLSLTSPYVFKALERINPQKTLTLSFFLYFISYIQRIKVPISFDSSTINFIIYYLSLYGMSLFPFLVGYLFSRHNIYSLLYKLFYNNNYKDGVGLLLILLMITLHGYIQTLFVAVFTGIATICIFNLLNKPVWVDAIFSYFGNHSTNIWLTHMFFYIYFFKEVVFYPKYSALIFLWLMILCIITSVIINKMLTLIQKIKISRTL